MFFYEVQIDVPVELEAEFVEWLIPHMEKMEELPCFDGSERLEVLDGDFASDAPRFLCRYFYESAEDFTRYLELYADNMRADLPDAWRAHLSFQRRTGSYTEL